LMRVSAGNGLTGGGNAVAGSVSLAMSGSYSGNFGATGQISANTVVANGITSNGNLSVGDQITCRHFYSSGDAAAGSWQFYITDFIHPNAHVWPAVDGAFYDGLAASAWLGVESYNYYTKSDPSLKRDIAPVPDRCLDLVAAIEPKTYKLDLEADEGRTHWGFLATEIGEAMQRAGLKFDGVRDDGDGRASLAYNETIAILWKAVQELTQQVEALKREKADV
jgi:hypothetical protein